MKNESNVNSYARVFPAVFESSEGDLITGSNGKSYLDFFCGAGALNYGHNHPKLKQALFSFLEKNSIVHCLDMDSKVKETFLDKFESIILKPRGLNYKVQFSGPTGTNAVEAAVKLARKYTKRRKVVSFTHSFHGMTATSLALSGSLEENQKINPSQDVIFFPYDGFFGEGQDTLAYLRKMITEAGSGIEMPAAIILETIQAEGGVNVASNKWLTDLRAFTLEFGIVLIVDDIQVGCGRSGNFFSFERAGIVPDMVLLSKSISGFGTPLSLVLIKPEMDIWGPGEHNGTFRANNLSLCTASEALDFWKDDSLLKSTLSNAARIHEKLLELKQKSNLVVAIRGIGMIWGLELKSGEMAKKVTASLFEQGMLIETCGNEGQVIKLLAPLNISRENLDQGLHMLSSMVLRFEKENHKKMKLEDALMAS
jgi:diaminobutyrate-2-oxoglutarate transaminase